MADKERQIKTLRMIMTDMEADAIVLDGMPFNGKVIAGALGHLGAAISALAGVMLSDLEETPSVTTEPEQPPINHFCYWLMSHTQPCRDEACEMEFRRRSSGKPPYGVETKTYTEGQP